MIYYTTVDNTTKANCYSVRNQNSDYIGRLGELVNRARTRRLRSSYIDHFVIIY